MFRLGIIGGRRPLRLIPPILAQRPDIQLVAVADTDPGVLDSWHKITPDVQLFDDWVKLLTHGNCNMVYIATPLHFHATQAITALHEGCDVLCEVPSCLGLDEALDLLEAVRNTGRQYSLAENYCFLPETRVVGRLIEQGCFGQLTFARGNYFHDAKALMFDDTGDALTWRGELKRDYQGNAYPTHSFGPIAHWFGLGKPGGPQMKSVSAFATPDVALMDYVQDRFGPDHVYREEGFFQGGDHCLTLIETTTGAVIELLLDMQSYRPSGRAEFYLQGTHGCYHSGRYVGESGLLALREPGKRSSSPFLPIEQATQQLLPQWSTPIHYDLQRASQAMVDAFLASIEANARPAIDVYDAVQWSALIYLVQQSLQENGAKVPFPAELLQP